MTDEELEKVAQAAASAVGPDWQYTPCHGVSGVGFVDTKQLGSTVTEGYDGEWHEAPGRHAAAFDPATALDLLRRLRGAEEALASSLRVGLEACQQAEKAEALAAQNGRLADAASDDVDALIRRVEVAEERTHAAEARVKELEAACIAAHRELFLGGGSQESASAAEGILSKTAT